MERKYYYMIGVLLAIIAVCALSFALLGNRNKDPKEPSKENEMADSVKVKEIKKAGEKFIETYDVTMNGKKSTFEIEYNYEYETDYANIYAKIKNTKEPISIEVQETDSEKFKNDNFTETNLKKKLTEDDFRFFKGEDGKSYLLVIVKTYHFVSGHSDYLYAFDDELKLVEGDIARDECSNDEAMTIRNDASISMSKEEPGKTGYDDTLGIYKNTDRRFYLNLKIVDDKIYYLKSDYTTATEGNYGTIEERIYTIKDSKWTYTIKDKYKITDGAGQMC